MNSLERRLQLGLVSSLVVLLFVFWWTVTLGSRLLTESVVHQRLRDDANNVVSLLDVGVDGSVTLTPHRLHPDYQRLISGRYFVIKTDLGSLSSRSAWEQFFDVPDMQPGQQSRQRLYGITGEPLLAWFGGFSRNGMEFTVAVYEDIALIQQRLRVFQWFAAAVAALLLFALLVVQHWVIRRSLEKLDGIRRDIGRLEQGRTGSLSEEVPLEIQPLVQAFNQLLRRQDTRLRQSRNAMGNLAHSLKGPLNLLLRETSKSPADRIDMEAITLNAQRIRQSIESELKRAQLAGRGSIGRRFDVEAELDALVGLLKQVYSEKAFNVRVNIGPEVQLVHDRQDMLEMIGNLLDNAAKWCKSLVLINLRMSQGVLIEVEDDGPGVSDAALSQLTERGVRLDESVSGHGLGLSIVQDIIASYDGKLTLERSNLLGGFKVSVHLPAKPASSAY